MKSPLLHRFRRGFGNHNKEWNIFRLRGNYWPFPNATAASSGKKRISSCNGCKQIAGGRKMWNYLALCSVFIDVVHKEFMFICNIFCSNTSMMPAQKPQTEATFGSLRSLQANSSCLNIFKWGMLPTICSYSVRAIFHYCRFIDTCWDGHVI